MWEKIKKQIIEKIMNELKCINNWDNIDNLILHPIFNKFKDHINKYLYFFLIMNILMIILMIINILIIIYSKK